MLTAILLGHALGQPPADPATRLFLMGFTRWPADLSLDGFLTAQDFAHAHGDIVSVMFIGGIPWPESLDGKPFSKDTGMQTSSKSAKPALAIWDAYLKAKLHSPPAPLPSQETP